MSSGLTVRGLRVEYDGTPAVRDADLTVPEGSVMAVLGPSGCGKSTVLRAIAGLEPAAAGTIAWSGADLAGVPTHRRGFALMFQDGQLFSHLSVAGNVGYALRLRRGRGVRRGRGSGAEARVAELLELVGLQGYGDRLPSTLSGGERQRVALARSLAAAPRLLLLDEPLSALDADLRQRLAGDLREILHAAGTTTLMVTHDQEEAFAVADRMAVLSAGRVVQEGEVTEVWAAPVDAETATFLGYSRVLSGPAADALDSRDTRDGVALPPGSQVALRRSSLVVDPQGALTGRVQSVRATPDQVRLVVVCDQLGEVDAVAGERTAHLAPGDDVHLRLDRSRIAVIPPSRSSRTESA